MNFGTFQGAGNGSPALTLMENMDVSIEQMFTTSQTWLAPKTGYYLILAVGAGGGGGSIGTGVSTGHASGGGAGGLAIKRAYLTQGTPLAITIGAGGADGATPSFTQTYTYGTAGGATTVTGGGLSLFAGGGNGGAAIVDNNSVTGLGVSGGTASGGDFNFTGGGSGGGSCVGGSRANTGGGAVAWYGIGYSSGTATVVAIGSTGPYIAATGGAGIGGNSGNATINTGNNTVVVYTGGGGTGGPSDNQSTNGGSIAQGAGGPGIQNQTNATTTIPSIFLLYGGGGTPPFNSTSGILNQGPGGGTPANGIIATSPPFSGYQSMLAGQAGSGSGDLNGLRAGLGGGGGGGITNGGSGGNGVVFIVWGYR